VAEHARAGPESALESLARGVSIDAGLPELTPQVEIRTRLGTFRVDLLDEENGVVLDADGKLKYDAPGALWSEKRREDALRDSGFEVVRFTMSDYHAQPGWIESYRGALARASRRPESASARQFALAQHSPCVSPGNRRQADGISNIPDGFRG
jgi:very-short-patch-repair endonuclease